MRHILTSLVLVVLLFPSLALGETVHSNDIVEREGLLYKKFTEVPFTGKVTGYERGKVKNGIDCDQNVTSPICAILFYKVFFELCQ